MPRIILDFDPTQQDSPGFTSDTSELVYFLSWAFSARYGGSHEMATASLALRGEFGIDLKPLLTFADREVEVPEDEDPLQRAWQDGQPLANTCRQIVEALTSPDTRLTELQENYPGLKKNIQELGLAAGWAAQQGALIRVTYLMEAD